MCIMKLIYSIYFILITKIAASFSSEFRNAVHSVENSFGKLFTDVVTDVRDTISCTLMAVEHVFAYNRFDKSSEYYKKCNGESVSNVVKNKVQEKPVLSNYKMFQEQQSSKNKMLPPLPYQMPTVNDYLYKRDNHNNLLNVKNVLGSESNRLAAVNNVIRQELDKMSDTARKKFNIFELNGRNPSVDSVWNHIKLLYDLEEEHTNSPEATEIRQTIDKVLDVLDIHENTNTPEKDKIKDIMNNLENIPTDKLNNIANLSPEWQNNESERRNEVQPHIEKQNIQIKKGRQIDDFPLTFKDVAKNIIENNTILNVNSSKSDEAINKTEIPLQTTLKPVASTTVNPLSNNNTEDYVSSNDDGAMDAAAQASQIIADSKRSQSILDSIFGDLL